jgi:plastocyanin
MFKLSQKIAVSLAVAATFAASAQAADTPSADHDPVVTIKGNASQAKWVDLNRGDTVKFTSNGIGYTLHLDKNADGRGVDLATIAPQAGVEGVRVYVTADAVARN